MENQIIFITANFRFEPVSIDEDIISRKVTPDGTTVTQEVKSWLELTFNSRKITGDYVVLLKREVFCYTRSQVMART